MSKRTDTPKEKRHDQLRVLVTGATGFVGSAIVDECMRARMDVLSTGRSDVTKVGMPGYFSADVTKAGSLKALSNVDCVIHAAGLAHQFGGGNSPAAFTEVNVKGTENVVRDAVRAGVKHFVLISSVSVYGSPGTGICDEATPPKPTEPYAQSKYHSEKRAIEITKGSDTHLTILRLATVYGEGDRGNVARLMRTIDRGRFVWVGDGLNCKSLIHRDDVARACGIVIRQAPAGINTYNVSGSVNTMREIVEGLASALGKNLPRWRIQSRAAKIMAVAFDRISRGRRRPRKYARIVEKWLENDVYDGSKIEREFGFCPKVSLSEGLQREVAWYRQGQVKA